MNNEREKIISKAIDLINSNKNKFKIVLINNNSDQFFESYKHIYEKRFNVKYDKNTFKKHLKNSLLFICFNKNQPVGIMRIKIINNNDKYLKYFKLKNNSAIFLSDLASAQSDQGIGTCMMNFLFNLSKNTQESIITVPWNDRAEEFYKKIGFKSYYPEENSLPKVIQIKK